MKKKSSESCEQKTHTKTWDFFAHTHGRVRSSKVHSVQYWYKSSSPACVLLLVFCYYITIKRRTQTQKCCPGQRPPYPLANHKKMLNSSPIRPTALKIPSRPTPSPRSLLADTAHSDVFELQVYLCSIGGFPVELSRYRPPVSPVGVHVKRRRRVSSGVGY